MDSKVNISEFTYAQGLDLGKKQSFTYLYGLSDFWQYLFQDTTSVNMLLEANSIEASDIYGKFLQLCSGISIADISNSASSQLRLEIISDTPNVVTDVDIIKASWSSGFTTLSIGDTAGLSIGDVIEITKVLDVAAYDAGSGINTNPINSGGITDIISGTPWMGSFVIINISTTGEVTYYQPTNPGIFPGKGKASIARNLSANPPTFGIGDNTYFLPNKIVSSRYLANRPFLPTKVLEEGVDFSVDTSNGRITFAKPLFSYGFPARKLASGATEYSIWFVDVRYDEDLVYAHFPQLLGRRLPQLSNEAYRNFLYGLFFIYTSGPTISTIEKGINLILGAPLARDSETVLEVRQYINTRQFIVITDLNSYLLPVGLLPNVYNGMVLKVGDALAKWVDILDDVTFPSWWRSFNTEVPEAILPNLPVGTSRVTSISADNAISWVMDTYLKNNTFLVKVNVPQSIFDPAQQFESVASILKELRPSSSYPLFSYHDSSSIQLFPVDIATHVGNFLSNRGLQVLGTESVVGVTSPGIAMNVMSESVVASAGTSISGITFSLEPNVLPLDMQPLYPGVSFTLAGISMGVSLGAFNGIYDTLSETVANVVSSAGTLRGNWPSPFISGVVSTTTTGTPSGNFPIIGGSTVFAYSAAGSLTPVIT